MKNIYSIICILSLSFVFYACGDDTVSDLTGDRFNEIKEELLEEDPTGQPCENRGDILSIGGATANEQFACTWICVREGGELIWELETCA